jgi:hypothetical protein
MTFASDPEEIAERIIDLHHHLGHMRHFLQMDIGGMPMPRYSSPSNYSGPRSHPGYAPATSSGPPDS